MSNEDLLDGFWCAWCGKPRTKDQWAYTDALGLRVCEECVS